MLTYNILSIIILGIAAYPVSSYLQKSNNLPLLFLIGMPVIYYSLGLAPLSSRRDYFEYEFWYYAILLIIFSLVSGWLLSNSINTSFLFKLKRKSRSVNYYSILIPAGLLLSLAAAILVVMQFGALVFDPGRRFMVSSYYLYLIELGVCASLLYISKLDAFKELSFKKAVLLFLVMGFVLTSSGYRSQLVLLLFGAGIYFLIKQNVSAYISYKKASRFISIGVSLLLLLIAVGYYFRVEFSGGDILQFDDRLVALNVFAPHITLPILPIHEAARENIGVTYSAINRLPLIASFVNIESFIWIELLTLLPGQSQTATGILGLIVNNSDTAFLTPGVIGGLYLSHGYVGIFIYFFSMAFLTNIIWRKIQETKSELLMAVLAVLLIYYTHFMYRGIFRPMYLLVFLYCWVVVSGYLPYAKKGGNA